MKIFPKFCVLALPLAIAACDTSVTPSYQTSPENTIFLRSLAQAGERASVDNVAVAAGVDVNPTCRLMGPLDIGGGRSVSETLRSALQAELLAANMFAPDGTPIRLTLTGLQVNSLDGFWNISGTVATPKRPQGFDVQTRFDYRTSFTAVSACQNTALAFNRAAAQFINDIVTNPAFAQSL